jgi:hypothetical protein
MTEAQDTTDRKLKWMRRIAKLLALVWGGLWTLLIAALAIFLILDCSWVTVTSAVAEPLWRCVAEASIVVPVVVILWIPAGIAWRREAIGGALLVFEGLLTFGLFGWIGLQDMLRWGTPSIGGLLFFAGATLPPLAAGSLFLLSWRRSTTSQSS